MCMFIKCLNNATEQNSTQYSQYSYTSRHVDLGEELRFFFYYLKNKFIYLAQLLLKCNPWTNIFGTCGWELVKDANSQDPLKSY